MDVIRNRKGMYEYILTKSVMLIFIMGLVAIFMRFHDEMNIKSASDIANLEAERISKQIDDIIGFKGVSNRATIHLTQDLYVGKEIVPYSLEITEKGVVVISLVQYPYHGIIGLAQFGLKIERKAGSSEKILCEWAQINKGASIKVEKTSSNEYRTAEEALYYLVEIKLDAADSCGEYMEFVEEFKESV